MYNQKDRRPEVYRIGVLDIEKSQLPDILPQPWQTDTCIGNWFYDVRQTFKRPSHIVEMLVDIISKNGTMLLNVLQRPDGSIDDEAVWILESLAGWFAVCSEGVYGTRPWRISSEGDTRTVIEGFTETEAAWTSSDYRFTCKGNTVYAFQMRAPENRTRRCQELPAERESPFRAPAGRRQCAVRAELRHAHRQAAGQDAHGHGQLPGNRTRKRLISLIDAGRTRRRVRPSFSTFFRKTAQKRRPPKGSLLRVAGKTGALYIIRW